MHEITSLAAAPAAELLRVRFVAFDFDGVFTDDTVYVTQEGVEMVRCWRGNRRVPCRQGLDDNRAALDTLVRQSGAPLASFAFVGNDINDLVCLTAVGLSIAVRNAHPDVLGCVKYRTDTPGGLGAVREVCDVLHRVHSAAGRVAGGGTIA